MEHTALSRCLGTGSSLRKIGDVCLRCNVDALRHVFQSVCRQFKATLLEMDGEDDHVHLLIEYPPKVPVSSLVNSLKGVSSRLLSQRRPDIRKRYWRGVLWSPSYFAASAAVRPSASFASTSRSRKPRIRRLRRL